MHRFIHDPQSDVFGYPFDSPEEAITAALNWIESTGISEDNLKNVTINKTYRGTGEDTIFVLLYGSSFPNSYSESVWSLMHIQPFLDKENFYVIWENGSDIVKSIRGESTER